MTAETILFWVAVLLAASSFNMLMTVVTRGRWSPVRSWLWHTLVRFEGEAFARKVFLLASLMAGVLAILLLWVRSSW